MRPLTPHLIDFLDAHRVGVSATVDSGHVSPVGRLLLGPATLLLAQALDGSHGNGRECHAANRPRDRV